MAETHLNDISKVYLDQVAEKKDDSYLETDMEKRQKNNEKARKELAKGPQMKNPHFESVEVEEGYKEISFDKHQRMYDRYKKLSKAAMQDARDSGEASGDNRKKMGKMSAVIDKSSENLRKKQTKGELTGRGPRKEEVELDENRRAARAAGGFVDDSKKQTDPSKAGFTGISGSIKDIMRQNKEIEARNKAKSKTESLDPVGKEDGDVNNDGKKDSTDSYLMKRRKAIAASINKKKVKESFSDWRTELSEVIGDTDVKKKSETPKIKEGNVDNASKIKINPEIKEAIEEIGGTLLEMVEVDEMDYILESVYLELIEEGFAEEDVEFAIEQALIQDLEEVTSPAAVASAKMRSGNGNPKRDAGAVARSKMQSRSPKPPQETKKPSFKDRLKSLARNTLDKASETVGKVMKKKSEVQSGPAKAKNKLKSYIDRAKAVAKAGYERGRGPVEKKTTYRNVGAGRKEKIGEDLVNEVDEKQMLAKKKQMMLKQQMIDKQRLQMQQQGKLPSGHNVEQKEEMSIADQMRISREANAKRKPYQPGDREKQRAAILRNAAKNAKKDTRTDAEKMADATGPRDAFGRPSKSGYRGD